jgi:hypothetical protein
VYAKVAGDGGKRVQCELRHCTGSQEVQITDDFLFFFFSFMEEEQNVLR